MSKQHLVVIGNGMVGHHFLEQLMASPAAATYHLRVFGAEQHPAYDRVHLSDYFSGAGHRELALAGPDWYERHGIHLHLGEPVTAIDRSARTVTTPEGEYSYDRLVLATGSYPFVPPIQGRDQPAVSCTAPWRIWMPSVPPRAGPAVAW